MLICSKYMCYLFYSLLSELTGLSQDSFTNRSRMLQDKILAFGKVPPREEYSIYRPMRNPSLNKIFSNKRKNSHALSKLKHSLNLTFSTEG